MGEDKNKLRTIYPKNHENLRTVSLGSNFTGSFKKRVITIGEKIPNGSKTLDITFNTTLLVIIP